MQALRVHRVTALAISLVALALTFGLARTSHAATDINLGAADPFAILAGSGITDVPPSVITGDVGNSPGPGSQITGLTQPQVTGTIYTVDATGPAGSVADPVRLTAAKSALTAAYGVGQSATPPTQTVTASTIDSFGVGTVNNGAQLVPGIYKSPSTMGVTGTLILNGGGDPNAVFIFQAGTSLTTAGASVISLINGAQACHVYWVVGTAAASIGANSIFKGTIMSDATIGLLNGANVEGRLLAFTGQVTLNQNTITRPTCVGAPPPAGTISTTPGSGANFFNLLPIINVEKVPSPLTLPAGPGPVTFTYRVTNLNIVPMNTVWVIDNKCAPVVYRSGDTNLSGLLDPTETWIYTCTTVVPQTETDTATAHGYGVGLGMDVFDTANATVVVGSPIVPPLIHLIKVPSVTVLPAGGGLVTYSYSITNPGTAPLSNVSITDDRCTGLPGQIVGHPGDINQNGLLDPGETFHFTCQSNVTQTTTNIGTAEGQANGLTAIDFSPATVAVAPFAPQAFTTLPNAGFGPEGGSAPWDVIIPAGALVAVLAYYRRKNQSLS